LYDYYEGKLEGFMENNLVLTTEEAAEFLKLTPFTVRDYARRGILPSRKVGRQGVAVLQA
jgi:excisionase family DNA binding protein